MNDFEFSRDFDPIAIRIDDEDEEIIARTMTTRPPTSIEYRVWRDDRTNRGSPSNHPLHKNDDQRRRDLSGSKRACDAHGLSA